MPATEPDNIFYPANSDPYNLVADMGTMANSMQSALNKRANLHSGTDQQRIAFTEDAVNGTLWANTDGNKKVYQFRNDKWWPEFEFIKINSLRGDFKTTDESGLYITSFGRMAHLSLFFEQATTFSWNTPKASLAKITVARLPDAYVPSVNISYYTAVWSPQSSRVDCLMQIRTSPEAHGSSSSGHVLVTLEKDEYKGTTSNRDATFNINATWPIYQA